MARIDDFIQAREISRKELAEKDMDSVAGFSGALLMKNTEGRLNAVSIRLLNRDVIVSWPEMEFSYNDLNDEVPIQHQGLILHYLNGAFHAGEGIVKGEWVSFQDLPDGRFYMDAFIKRAKDPLLKAFGSDPKSMAELASRLYNGRPAGIGDFSSVVNALPMVPVALVLWEGDDEFPPEGNILFDRGISGILPAEDIALLAGMVVYPLIGMGKR